MAEKVFQETEALRDAIRGIQDSFTCGCSNPSEELLQSLDKKTSDAKSVLEQEKSKISNAASSLKNAEAKAAKAQAQLDQAKNAVKGSGSGNVVKEIPLSRSQSPEAVKHLKDTGQLNRPLTVDRPGAAARRKGNMQGVETKPGKDRDESPPAVFKESEGASVRHIPSGDNRSAGAQLGNALKGVPDNAKVIIKSGK
jgi:hypothetical protein